MTTRLIWTDSLGYLLSDVASDRVTGKTHVVSLPPIGYNTSVGAHWEGRDLKLYGMWSHKDKTWCQVLQAKIPDSRSISCGSWVEPINVSLWISDPNSKTRAVITFLGVAMRIILKTCVPEWFKSHTVLRTHMHCCCGESNVMKFGAWDTVMWLHTAQLPFISVGASAWGWLPLGPGRSLGSCLKLTISSRARHSCELLTLQGGACPGAKRACLLLWSPQPSKAWLWFFSLCGSQRCDYSLPDRWQACVPALTRVSCWISKAHFPFGDRTLQNLIPRLQASASGFHCQAELSLKEIWKDTFPGNHPHAIDFYFLPDPLLITPTVTYMSAKYWILG